MNGEHSPTRSRKSDPVDYDRLAREELDRICAVARHRDLNDSVPSCPHWSLRDLLVHLGRVYSFYAEMTRTGSEKPFPFSDIPAPEINTEIAWIQQAFEDFRSVVGIREPDEFAWSFTPNKTVAWVNRRALHETLIHRFDVELSVGDVSAVDPGVASDCVDEFLESFFLGRASDAEKPLGSVHLHCTDVDGEWIIESVGGEFVMRREHAKGDVAVRGKAVDLAQLLWRRLPLSSGRFEIFGDAAVADTFCAYARL